MQRKRRCCWDKLPLTETFELLTVIIVFSDLALAGFFLSLIVILIMGWCDSLKKIQLDNWMNPDAGLSPQQFLQVYAAVIWVFLPVMLMLALKCQRGWVWVRAKKKVHYHSYYFASQVFYITYVIQLSLVVLTSRQTLNSKFYYLTSWSYVLAFAFLILLQIQLTLVDKDNEELGVTRR